jgi:hypothetical protein
MIDRLQPVQKREAIVIERRGNTDADAAVF